MNDKVKIQITEDEWAAFPADKRDRVLELMQEAGYPTEALEEIIRDIEEGPADDIFKQFYGDEE